jgi:invasion protein IalB
MSRARSVAVMASLTALVLAAPAPAQDGVAAWRVECTGDGKTLDCRAIQQLFHRESRQLLLMVLARRGPDPKTAPAQLTIQLPLGLNLTEPVLVRVDNGAADKQPIQTCTNIGCFVSMTASPALVSAMRSGQELKITVYDGNKKPIEMGVPLLGFGLAFDKARG